MKANGGPGIVAYELAKLPASASAILERWGEAGRAAAMRSLLIDYLWVPCYVALLGGWLYWANREVQRNEWTSDGWMGFWGMVPTAAVIVAGLLDWVENTCLVRQLLSGPTHRHSATAYLAARAKFVILVLSGALAMLLTSALWLGGGIS